MKPNTSLSHIVGIGPTYLSRLKRLGIVTAADLLYHFPFRYEDLSVVKKIAELVPGEVTTVHGSVWEVQNLKTRRGKWLTKALVNDGSGSIDVTWFNQPYLTKVVRVGSEISLAGKVETYGSRMSLVSPDYEIGRSRRHTGRIVPIYPETEGLSSKWLRNKFDQIIPEVVGEMEEYLPAEVLSRYKLIPLIQAIRYIHLPQSYAEVEAARRRFGFEELFLMQMAALMRKSVWKAHAAPELTVSPAKLAEFISSLPFTLTHAQEKVLQEILADLTRHQPMNRLLMGDVGSGKTVVAAAAAFIAHANGYQTALMAPTEILAQQHFATLTDILKPFGLNVGLLTGSKKTPVSDVTVGTQALLSRGAEFKKLGLVVIDEQHRFGVSQRAILKEKGLSPHTLTMTATPIPRTLALTLYGDLNLSVIDELPPGRKKVKTYLTPSEKRDRAYQFLREKITQGQQVFIITPLIEPSESLQTVRSVKEEYRRLSQEVFPDLKLGLLHGKLTSAEKETTLDLFRSGRTNILVATPVVEVGIDIPNATVMVIEGADRFGLAQLHQLRGRVGRGAEESWCLLFTDELSGEVAARLKALETHHRGEELAEIDLKLRGPGELYGLRQSGLPDFKVADLTDLDLIAETRRAAGDFLDHRPKFSKHLAARLEPLLQPRVSPD